MISTQPIGSIKIIIEAIVPRQILFLSNNAPSSITLIRICVVYHGGNIANALGLRNDKTKPIMFPAIIRF